MTAKVIPLNVQNQSADEKRQLVKQCLATLQTANAIDERDSQVEDWMTWYDDFGADCRSIEVLAGAMAVEAAIRRGERILAEGERRGGDGSNQYTGAKVTTEVTLAPVEKKDRSHDRELAEQAEEVRKYAREESKKGKRPTPTGARRHLRQLKGTPAKKRRRPPSTPGPKPRTLEHASAFQVALDKLRHAAVCDGQPVRFARFTQITGLTFASGAGSSGALTWVRIAREVPYLRIEKTAEAVCITYDADFAEVCAHRGSMSHPKTGATLLPAAEIVAHCREFVDRIIDIYENRIQGSTLLMNAHMGSTALRFRQYLQQYDPNYRGDPVAVNSLRVHDAPEANAPAAPAEEGHNGSSVTDS